MTETAEGSEKMSERETALEALRHIEAFGLEGQRSGKVCAGCEQRVLIIREQLVVDLVEKIENFDLGVSP